MCKNLFLKVTFRTLEGLLRKLSLKIFFIIGKDILKRNLTITLTLITKSNFTLSYPNKNYSLKFTFKIFKIN